MDKKLAPHFAWLFALGAIALGTVFAIVLANKGWSIVAPTVGLTFAAAGVASSYLTRASKPQAIIPMVVAGLGVGIVTFISIKHALQALSSLDGSLATGVTILAAVATLKVLGVTLVAGVGGALGGFQLRGKSFGDLLKRPG